MSFPEANRLERCLSLHRSLNTPYNQKNGITKVVAELAAKKLGGTQTTQLELELDVQLIMEDLKDGKDRFSGETLPKLVLERVIWESLSKSLNKALIDIVNSHSVTVL